MRVNYDTYYETENLFGSPYPELIEFFAAFPERGKVLDVGCGQGRDALALARLGYEVVGIDHSQVGIEQMNQVAQSEKLNVTGRVEDLFAIDDFGEFDFILLDSMFHFTKKDRQKEVNLIQKILSNSHCVVVICIQDTGNKVKILNETLNFKDPLPRVADKSFTYTFDTDGHQSKTQYRLIAVRV